MALDVVWTSKASQQLQLLSSAEQANVQHVITTLRNNPDVGRYDYTRPLPSGGQQIVYSLYGLLVKVRYTYRGLLRRKIAFQIEEVMPTDLLSQDEYEERTHRYMDYYRDEHRVHLIIYHRLTDTQTSPPGASWEDGQRLSDHS